MYDTKTPSGILPIPWSQMPARFVRTDWNTGFSDLLKQYNKILSGLLPIPWFQTPVDFMYTIQYLIVRPRVNMNHLV